MSRTPREETKRLIIDTGVRLLMDRGLNGGCENVGMADVLTEIESVHGRRITNASVYGRIWDSQTDFHRDLLMCAAEQFPDGEEVALHRAATAIIAEADLSTRAGRVAALDEVCRTAGLAHLEALEASRSWQTWLAIWAITVSTPTLEDDIERGPSIAHRHALAVDGMAEVLNEIFPLVEATVKPGFTTHQIAMAIYALSEGLVLHDRFAADDRGAVNVNGRSWSLFSISFQGILSRFVEQK
jgi:hypothetical protein